MKKFLLCIATLFLGQAAICQNPLLLKDVYPGATGSGIQQIVKTSNYTFFNAQDGSNPNRGLYRTDGTTGGTIKLNLTYLPDPPPSPNNYISTKADKLTALGNKVIFAGDNTPGYGEIWASDGTQAGTIAIERFTPSGGASPIVELGAMGAHVYYSAINNSNQAILKRTDGTIAGTTEIYNFGAYPATPEVVFLTPLNNILYFILYDVNGTGVDQLWRSDGTNAGTYIVFDFTIARFVQGYIMPMDNNLYIMIGNDNGGLRENTIWKSDGTMAGTVPLKLIGTNVPGPINNIYPPFAVIGSTLYFAGLDGNGKELWKTDGTTTGTTLLADINPGAASSNPLNFTVLNDNLYFTATTASEGTELRKYDGTSVSLVKDIITGTASGANLPAGPGSRIAVSNGTLLFSANNNVSGAELWISDGTAANTRMVADINTGGSSSPALLTGGNPVYFSANNGVNGSEIFKFDNADGVNGLRKIYVNDNGQIGDVFTTAVGNNNNPGTKAAPVATITYAVGIAQAGDTIMVDAGTYTEQVTTDKSITITGAGKTLTSILKPVVTVPPPGPFFEQAVIQTAQNIGDVFISDMSITGGPDVTPVILQTGGSVKNCNLQGGNQGIFFRIESATKTAVVENNIISAEYIAVNFQGSGLSASLINNEMSAFNAGFSAGMFVGLDFGPVPQLTISKNKFTQYYSYGIFGGSYNGNVFENSFTGAGAAAIQSFNSLSATCNWYGTDDAEIIRSKITGPVSYAPWLISGVDTNPAAPGFQPAAGTCMGRQNKFYVNDNSRTGDVLTSAVGNNANNGFSVTPFATINYAISVAQSGDTIMVDAGTYVENVIVNKSLTLRGVKYGQNPGASVDRSSESIIMPAIANTALASAIMQPAADNIVIDGFMFDGDNPALTGGINVNGADANIGCGIYNNGIFAASLIVKNNIVKNTAAYGIGLFRSFVSSPGPVVSTNNLFTQNRVHNCGTRGIVFGYNAYGNVTNNHISQCASSGTWFSQQTLQNIDNNPSYLTGNRVENCGLGMQSSGLQPNASAVHYLNNEITGISSNFAGISLLINNIAGGVAANNKISGPNVGVYINATNPSSTVLVNNNSFTSISTFAIQSVNSFAVSATCNWFGSANRNDIAAKISGPMVNYTPWLNNGTDSDPAIGFQPVANSCLGRPNYYVNDNSLTGDSFTTAVGSNGNNGSSASPFATIDYAVGVAQPGDTLFVDAGDHAIPNFSITKNISILGTNYLVSPNNATDKTQYNTVRNAEARITGGTMTIGADWIIMEGLRFSANTAISLNADYSHIKFYKNYFDVASAGNTISLQGASTSPLVAFDFALTDNRFERTDNLTGNALFLGAVKNLWIDNNVFIESGPVVNRSTGIRTSTVTAVESILVSNNFLKKLSNSIAPSILNNGFINSNVFDSCAQGVIYTPNTAVSSNVTISGNRFTNLRIGRSVLVRGGSGGGINGLTVANNTINQAVDGINGIVSMIQLEYAVGNTFGNTNVQNNTINISGNYANSIVGMNNGIQLVGKHNNTTIENNEINFTAINAGPPAVAGVFPPVPAGIYVATDGIGIIPATAVINIRNNKIQGFKTSVAFYDPTPSGVTSNVGYGYLTNGATVNISNNSFTADSISIDNGIVSQIVTATCNWYGSANTPAVLAKNNGLVSCYSWLMDGTDTDIPTPGFQPAGGTCTGRQNQFYVNDNSQAGDVFTSTTGSNSNTGSPSSPFATPDYAYSIAQAGDTIYVDAGTYDLGGLTYSFPKPITLLGSNYQVTPNNPANKIQLNTARNAESILINGKMSIASSGISIEGFTWDVGNRTAVELVNAVATNNDFGNFKFVKNIFKISNTTAGLSMFAITGKFVTTPALPVTSGYNILDNRFEKNSAASGNTFNFNFVKDVLVTDNSFVVTGTTLRTQQAVIMGSSGLVSAFTFSNNRVEGASTAVGGNRIAAALITGNKMHNVNNTLSTTNSLPETSSIEFSNNEAGNDLGTPFMLYNGGGTGTSNILRVENNLFTGASVAGVNQLFATMNLTLSNTLINPSIIIRGNKINYTGDFSSVDNQFFRPLTVRGNIANVILENNELRVDRTGSLPAANPAVLLPINPGITIGTDLSPFAYMPSNAVVNIQNNKIHGFQQSVVFYDGASAGHDTYTGYGNIPAGAVVNILNNSFTGDSISVNNGATGQAVNATCNWYGSAAVQNVLPKISTSSVNYTPWLVNGTDADLASGFQPVAGACSGTSPVITLDNSTPVSCFSGSNGTISITVTNGTAPFTFNWSRNGVGGYSSMEDPTNLVEGSYSVTATDANGSTATLNSILITQPVLLVATASGTNNICFGGSIGSATVVPTGGPAPYSYLWSNGGTAASISNLIAGAYAVTVTDANGCTANSSYTVTQPTQVVAAITDNSTVCTNIATASATGGTGAYSFAWSNGATTATITNVPAGVYTVVVTDANGCTATAVITLTVKDGVKPRSNVTDVSCYGGSNGTFTITSASGLAPFSYSIDGINFQASNTFTGLTAGTYTIIVKDANGCTGFETKAISQPVAISVTLQSLQNICFGGPLGSISIIVTGGTPGYTYNWAGPNGYTSTSKNISSLAAGTYTLTVTDTKACTKQFSATVLAFAQITVTEQIINVGCRGGDNGAIALTVTGGTNTGFSLSWNGPGGFSSTAQNITGLKKGTYNVSVTDNTSGCVAARTYTITEPNSSVSISASAADVTSCGNLGSIAATASGGAGSYQYKLNAGSYQASGIFSNLLAGIYLVTVKDINGCTDNKSVEVKDKGDDDYEKNDSKNKAAVISIGSVINARIAVSNDPADWFKFTTPAGASSYTVSLTHPSASFSFSLYATGNNTPALVPTSSTATSKTYSLSGSSTYYVEVTGGLSFVCYNLMIGGGSQSLTRLPEEKSPGAKDKPGDKLIAEVTALSAVAYPNPHQGTFNLRIASPENGLAKIELFSVNGQKFQEKMVSVQKGEANIVPVNLTQNGTVFYRVQIGKYSTNGKVIGTN
jgi:ELWxxDGT repeat protein